MAGSSRVAVVNVCAGTPSARASASTVSGCARLCNRSSLASISQRYPLEAAVHATWSCSQVYRDILGRLQDRAASRSTDCAGGGEQQLAGSILRFPNGQYWLDIPDAPGHELVVNSRGGVVEMTQW
jgi:hypothetical protein